MPLFRRLILPLLFLLTSHTHAEQALQLTAEIAAPHNLSIGAVPPPTPVVELLPDPSREVKDDLPPIPTIDLTTPPDDLWQRMRNGFSMPDLDSPLVADRQAWYLNRPDLLKRIFERSRRYLHHIVDELEKRGMPTELALLPIVESSFNPLAYSSARALGMWQFIPSTGKNYKLQQNWWFDQRRDIVASTSAALDYLQYIYEMHGDWHLALASYNWGEGAVGRAVAKNRAKGMPTDYLSLKMPGETRYYVPKLQAIKNIIAQPQLFGISLDPIPNRPYFGTVERSENMDVALAARLAEIPVEEFIALNPAYSRPVMPGTANSPLVLPAEKVQTFLANLQNHEAQDKPLTAWLTHKLKKGEKLEGVASRYGISAARLKQLNGINARTKVTPGFALLVPGKDAIGHEDIAARLPQTPAKPPRATKWKKGKGKAKGVAVKIRKPAVKPKKR
ncbi:transglycosylase SLT domain-containing protein [Sulfuritalea hydrogenivorans]|jgi:membrane-bound lytic murein transglycosylase D|uniref:LysM repeat-containing protein n=1 Tax=Sulfuritalea hydrogenivorans sk43H TaxID=1223802 RepID=W0SDF8_9PROT|nr:transglycosylase SLT domain-containing protein [Sulfuritalea hydrogenivorans]MDK9716079.1 transglycosylase SLT domain-containing protein [Sulfuritalea sp.]BAO28967.1 LysM repeat-containing protein [Sulfuritalea hydrogenivorans sk43H]